MSNYHFVSGNELNVYVRRLQRLFPTLQDFLNDVEESIKALSDSTDNYADEIRFYERVENKLLVLINKEKLGKAKNK